jgi:ABC-2 type transport system permease protein
LSRIVAIAWKDVRSTMRNVPALAMMLLAPLALAALLGFAFGGGQSFSISATKVAVANADTGAAGAAGATENAGAVVVGVMKSPDLKGILTVSDKRSAAAARKSVDDGKTAAAVVIPADLSSAIFGTSPTAPAAAVEVYENPTQQIGGAITRSEEHTSELQSLS